MNKLKKMQEIEKKCYPAYIWQLQEYKNMSGLILDYIESDNPIIIMGENYYFLSSYENDTLEIVDFASIGKISIFGIINKIISDIGNYPKFITGDFRESTSYKFVKYLTRKYSVVCDNSYNWEDEVFHEIKLIIK
jgi:hypothetical protein